MRIARHNAIVEEMAEKLESSGKWNAEFEPKYQTNQRPDPIIRSKDRLQAASIDPTIRWEVSADNIRKKNQEKEDKYRSTAEDLKSEGFQSDLTSI